MPIKILMPALSPTMTEGNIAKWHKKEGDEVRSGDVIAEIETDKATMEVEAADEGTLGKIVVPEGTEGVKVNEVIALLLAEGEDKAALAGADVSAGAAPKAAPAPASATATPAPAARPQPSAPVARGNGHAATPLARRMAAEAGLDLAALAGSGPRGKVVKADIEAALADASVGAVKHAEGRVFASPLARRMAREANIDVGAIPGSGPGGRVVKLDVARAMREGVTRAAPGVAPAISEPPYEDVRVSQMRKVIAERLSESKRTIPHYYVTVDCEIDQLLASRAQLNARPGHEKLSVNDFIILAVARALADHPQVNAIWQGATIRRYKRVDVAVAVALPEGLITPLIRDANAKSIDAISAEMKALAERARAGKLTPEEYQGGAFSISNLGMFGVKQFDAVINPPHSGILAVGAGEPRPVVHDGQLAIATVMSMTLSADHRIVDGATGAQFIATVKRYLEAPVTMFVK
jgi:pyruvate dehydrogenase E2 component (dihydrolipoyllysine-residue acetyltransferase)